MYVSLGRYCAYLDQVRREEEEAAKLMQMQANNTALMTTTVAMVTTGTRAPKPWWEWDEDDVTRVTPTTEAPPETIWDEIIGENSLQTFRNLIVYKVTPYVACFGIFLNIIMLLLLSKHRQLPRAVSQCFTATVVSATAYIVITG